MSRVMILGGGVAGLAAARRVSRVRGVDCTLVDRKGHFEFLPMLPDLLSRRVDPGLLRYDLADLARRIGFRFVRAELTSIDLQNRTVAGASSPPLPLGEGQGEGGRRDDTVLRFDHLVIATGSETDFHGRDDLAARVLKLDSVADAECILREADCARVKHVLLVGGGYTGIEVATNLRRHYQRRGRRTRILVVEAAPVILGTLEPWMRRYARDNLRRMDIDVATGTTLEDFRDGVATLSDGSEFADALVVWSAGVRTGEVVRGLDASRARQDRLVVDEHLGLCEAVFVAGDAACALDRNGRPMRLAVQIALDEGAVAGENVVRAIRGRPLVRYRPLDLGWVVPMANFRSCGTALGFHVRGAPATMLHYAMCLFRSLGLRRRAEMLLQLLGSRA